MLIETARTHFTGHAYGRQLRHYSFLPGRDGDAVHDTAGVALRHYQRYLATTSSVNAPGASAALPDDLIGGEISNPYNYGVRRRSTVAP